MCDTYKAKCSGCGCRVEVHIGDGCVPRAMIKAYCTRCTPKLLKHAPRVVVRQKLRRYGDRADIEHDGQRWFFDYVTRVGDHGQVEGARRGQMVVLISDDPSAHDVYLN